MENVKKKVHERGVEKAAGRLLERIVRVVEMDDTVEMAEKSEEEGVKESQDEEDSELESVCLRLQVAALEPSSLHLPRAFQPSTSQPSTFQPSTSQPSQPSQASQRSSLQPSPASRFVSKTTISLGSGNTPSSPSSPSPPSPSPPILYSSNNSVTCGVG